MNSNIDVGVTCITDIKKHCYKIVIEPTTIISRYGFEIMHLQLMIQYKKDMKLSNILQQNKGVPTLLTKMRFLFQCYYELIVYCM